MLDVLPYTFHRASKSYMHNVNYSYLKRFLMTDAGYPETKLRSGEYTTHGKHYAVYPRR
jgi:hypothetical protein